MFNKERIQKLEREIVELRAQIPKPGPPKPKRKKIVVIQTNGKKTEIVGTRWVDPGTTYYYVSSMMNTTNFYLNIFDGDEQVATFKEWHSIQVDSEV